MPNTTTLAGLVGENNKNNVKKHKNNMLLTTVISCNPPMFG